MNTEENPCNFCGTPNSEFPNKKCARTPICTNKIVEKKMTNDSDILKRYRETAFILNECLQKCINDNDLNYFEVENFMLNALAAGWHKQNASEKDVYHCLDFAKTLWLMRKEND